MTKKLVLVAHDNFENSKNNKTLLASLENVTIHHLKDGFDVAKEQEILLAHDEIIFQFPMQWFSTPYILKQWLDKVLAWGFAYGDKYALEGKSVKFVVTCGGTEEAYSNNGSNQHTIKEFILPLLQTVNYIKMNTKGIFAVHNVYGLTEDELKQKTAEYKNFI